MTPVAARRETASPASASDEDRWRVVVRRDRRSDGVFYFSVRTTGVYCR
jgi:AraC family transcriptional regulator of adaptative response/methylated-DNA-[protein]-cysteine methyltransferase